MLQAFIGFHSGLGGEVGGAYLQFEYQQRIFPCLVFNLEKKLYNNPPPPQVDTSLEKVSDQFTINGVESIECFHTWTTQDITKYIMHIYTRPCHIRIPG